MEIVAEKRPKKEPENNDNDNGVDQKRLFLNPYFQPIDLFVLNTDLPSVEVCSQFDQELEGPLVVWRGLVVRFATGGAVDWGVAINVEVVWAGTVGPQNLDHLQNLIQFRLLPGIQVEVGKDSQFQRSLTWKGIVFQNQSGLLMYVFQYFYQPRCVMVTGWVGILLLFWGRLAFSVENKHSTSFSSER